MTIYIAFLRGINVGGKKIIKMEKLKDIFKSLYFQNVKTYIQSGNVIFDSTEESADILYKIETELENVLGYKVTSIIRTADELEEIIKQNPFSASEDVEKQYVTFLHREPTVEAADRLMSYKNDVDDFCVTHREVFLLCGKGYGKTKFSNHFLESKLDVLATTRNWKTVNKILNMIRN
ncbi:DUF1697 domain-containing protein [Ectobacillus funiculus]|jgi:uncharacterized protein (DUF1697 family)|uniref:DUF1697 domain-containing protein n=1 Tax=Ectobacillus funiculus TaxID=137993 RepID=UPI00101DA6BB|nr:DUF1697 domain-containing protein [Ectobacillus funiculus]